jgi:hypothetical protein
MKKIIAVMLVYLSISTFAHGQIKIHPYGVAWLAPVHDSVNKDNPDKWSAWTNPVVAGVVARQSWESLETADGTFDPTYLDTVRTDSYNSGYWMEIEITIQDSRVSYPSWLTAQPVTLHDNATNPNPVTIPIPWDPTFQAKWREMVTWLGNRYEQYSNIRVVMVTGVGRDDECYFCSNNLATGDWNWLQTHGGATAWQTAATTIAGFYRTAFPTTRIEYATGAPLPDSIDEKNLTMQNLMTLLDNQYNTGGHYFMGWTDHGFTASSNGLVEQYTGPFKGCQETKVFGDAAGPLATYAGTVGMEWMETYDSDCTDANNANAFKAYNTLEHP